MKKAVIVLTVTAMLFLTACGTDIYDNFREVERIELIRCMAVDLDGGQIRVTAVSDSENGIYVKSAPTIAEAVTELEQNCREYDAYFSHTENVVIGRTLAEAGIGQVLDYIARAMKMRMDTGVFVSACGAAGDIMTKASPGDLTAIYRDAPRLGLGSVLTCRDVAANLAADGCSLIMAVSSDGGNIIPDGCGIIADGAMCGLISRDDMPAVSVITGSADGGVYTAYYGGVPVALSLTKSETSAEAKYGGETVENMNFDVKLTFNVSETSYPADVGADKVRLELEKQLEAQVRENVSAALKKSQDMGVDYLGVGTMLNEADPHGFHRVADRWNGIFPELAISVNADAEIIRTYDLNEPQNESGEGGQIVTK